MRRVPIGVLALSLGLGAAACDLVAPPGDRAPEGREAASSSASFRSRIQADASGDYVPLTPVRVSGRALQSLHLGHPDAFAAHERGERVAGYAPILLIFDGARITPDSYEVTDSTLRMAGSAQGLGRVELRARLNPDALATARRNLGDEGAVIEGVLTVDGRDTPVRLRWQGGG